MNDRPAKTAPGTRLERTFTDPFWTHRQRLAFLLACRGSGVQPTRKQAVAWKRQDGEVFAYWRSLSRAKRRAWLDREFERSTT